MNRIKIFLNLSLMMLLGATSCSDQEEYSFDQSVDLELQEFFDSFASEALNRDVEINWDEEEIVAEITTISTDALGQCLTFEQGRRQINIDLDFWQSSNRLAKEFLIFHELGHCVLGRSHNDTSTNGICTSMMTSGEGICLSNYSFRTRDEYLDELFFN